MTPEATNERIALSPYVLDVLIRSVWDVARRSGSVGLADAAVGGDQPSEPQPARPETDRDAGATPEPMSGGSVASADRLPCGVAPTAGPAAPLVYRAVLALYDSTSEETSYGRAQRTAYRLVLSHARGTSPRREDQ